MSEALYSNIFTQCQSTRFDRLKRRKTRMKERLQKLGIYSGFIAGCAMVAADPIQYTAVASAICLVMEVFRR